MNIHEYQAKQILESYGIPILKGSVAYTPEEAVALANAIEGSLWVVKAQIHAGGRGKAGGVILTRSLEEVANGAKKLLGSTLVTHQTGHSGSLVKRIFIEQGCAIQKEYYISLIVNRIKNCLTFIACADGGIDIEEIAQKTPEKIIKEDVDPAMGFSAFHARKLAFALDLPFSVLSEFVSLLKGLYEAFKDLDMSMLEINPLVLTKENQLFALDAKITFDDSALSRHPEIEALRDENEEDPAEHEAKEHDLNYIKLDGNIGCMVNGAGLAMATMDIIQYHGGAPANFLDVGGGATKEKVTQAFKIILKDPHVKAILINIFGGIMRCDTIAQGILAAAEDVHLSVPMVVRLQGTNKDLGKEILSQSSLKLITADNLNEAAKKVVMSIA